MERLVKLEVLGQEYPLYTDASEEDIQEILQLVQKQIEKNSKSSRSFLPANKVAVLTSLNVAGEYVRLKKDFEQYKQQMSELVERLTSVIEDSLPSESDPAAGFSKKGRSGKKTGLASSE